MRAAVFLAAAFAGLAACARPLPEEGSTAAAVYRERCGSCHRPYSPAATRFPTWEMIFPRMEQRMAAARMPPLSAAEREMILDYLKRNSS